MNRGTVKTVFSDRGFMFISRADGEKDCFAHIRDCEASLPFDDTLVGRTVEFEVAQGDRGPIARGVRAI